MIKRNIKIIKITKGSVVQHTRECCLTLKGAIAYIYGSVRHHSLRRFQLVYSANSAVSTFTLICLHLITI